MLCRNFCWITEESFAQKTHLQKIVCLIAFLLSCLRGKAQIIDELLSRFLVDMFTDCTVNLLNIYEKLQWANCFVLWQASEPQHFLYDPVSIASRQLSSALAAAVTMTTPRSATEADRSASVRTAVTKPDAQATWVINSDNSNSNTISNNNN